MKTNAFLILLLFTIPLMGLNSCGSSDRSEEKIEFDNAFIVDVRTPEEFNGGSFEGAINIPLNTVEDNIDKFEGKKQVVVYCRSGNRSGKALKILETNGITDVINGINQDHLEKLKNKE